MNPALPLDRLLDDASQFPPGNLALEPAWEAHRRWRASDRAFTVGRFLMPSARAEALAGLLDRDGAEGIEFGVVIAKDQLDGVEALAAKTTSVELRGAADDARAWRERFPEATVFVEGAPVEAIARLRNADPRIGAKLRCGGLEAAAFPSAEAVASFIHECVTLDVPFKATAGLHQPLRHWDPQIGAFHHGFLNIWAATALAARGAQRPELVACLESESCSQLPLPAPELARARRWFTAFGTCSIEEPLEGLAALGLLDTAGASRNG